MLLRENYRFGSRKSFFCGVITEFVPANPLYITHRFSRLSPLRVADQALVLLATWTSLSMRDTAVAFTMGFTAAHQV